LYSDFGGDFTYTNHQLASMKALMDLVESNGVKVFDSLYDVAVYLNNRAEHIAK